jgi:hypothetical protein
MTCRMGCIMTLSIMALNIMLLNMFLLNCNTEHYNIQDKNQVSLCRVANADSCIFNLVMLIVFVLNVIMQNLIVLNVVGGRGVTMTLRIMALNIITRFCLLSVATFKIRTECHCAELRNADSCISRLVMLSVIMLNVVVLNVLASNGGRLSCPTLSTPTPTPHPPRFAGNVY